MILFIVALKYTADNLFIIIYSHLQYFETFLANIM